MAGIYPDPNGHGIAIYVTVSDTSVPPGTQVPTLFLMTLDPATGAANIPTVGTAFPGMYASGLAGSPGGDSIVAAGSETAVLGPGASGTVTALYLSTTTFEITTSATPPVSQTWPTQVVFGPAGALFYAQYKTPTNRVLLRSMSMQPPRCRNFLPRLRSRTG